VGGSNSAVIWASVNCCRRMTHAFQVPEAGRPADPGGEVDRGGALQAEGAAERRLADAAVSGAASHRPRKTVTDSPRSGDAPDTARKAA
jgi:hypothetical protein